MQTSVYVRERTTSGTGKAYYKYLRIKEGQGRRTGGYTAPFYIRVTHNGKQIWHKLQAETFEAAKTEGSLGARAVDAQRQGLTVKEAQQLTDSNRVLVSVAVDKFLDQKRRKKSEATYQNYKFILQEFLDELPASVRFVDQINADVLDSHMRYLERQKAAPKTISNKMMVVSFMLKAAGVATPSKMMELPTVEEEIPEPYTREDLQALFKAMTPEERVRYTFFLDTACREKEVAHAQWADLIDGKYWVRKKTFKARGGKERQFSPKSHETRLIPLTRELMDMLNARKKSSKSQWIFPNEWGDPEGHFLRKFKAVAKEAGLNCGECETTISEGRFTKHPAEVSCLTRPVCEKHYLHRLRKTCATFWHEKHIPIRTIQYWLGHKSLETTQKYLGIKDSAELQEQINAPKY
jgi:integrase